MTRDDGGPAFPQHAETGNCEFDKHGASLLDYFAAKALPSTLSASASGDGCYDYVAAAIGAYHVADAMIAERGKPAWVEVEGPKREQLGSVNASNGADEPELYPMDPNMRLLFAAPALLNACRLALTRLNDGTEVSAKVAEHVRAAIAKAEGAK